MRTLNCKRMVQMLPLYVAGDLAGASEGDVAAHLAACEGCRRLSEEFSESSNLLTEACRPPEFGEEFYSGIRRAVLGEITRSRMPARPSFFRRRWVYATAFAALVIAAAVMLQQFSGPRRQTPQDLAVTPPVNAEPTPDQAKGSDSPSSAQLPGLTQAPQKPEGFRRTPGIQSQKIVATPRTSGQFKIKPDTSATAQTALDPRTAIAQALQLSTSASTSVRSVAPEPGTLSGGPTSASASKFSRIEIQTSDPNIRIIWLTQESRQPTETNHDPDQNKNGKRR